MKNLSKKFKLLGGVILSIVILTAFSINRKKKVTICHHEKYTINVSESALPGHLKHGDKIGVCRGGIIDN